MKPISGHDHWRSDYESLRRMCKQTALNNKALWVPHRGAIIPMGRFKRGGWT